MSQPPKDEVLSYEPNCTLKAKLGEGFTLASLITDDVIAACDNLIADAAGSFFEAVGDDLDALESLVKEPLDLERLHDHAYHIMSHAKVLGFTLVTDLCLQLIATLASEKLAAKKKLLLVTKLVEGLRIAFSQQIRDDGGKTGEALQKKLAAIL